MMLFQTEAKGITDPETLAKKYLLRYFENRKIEYPINPFQMLKDEGILFSLMNFKKLEGVYIPASDDNDMPVVGINANRPITRQRFTAAHELCHHFRDADQQISCPIFGKKSPIENFADKFAAALLMPLQDLRIQVNKRKNARGEVSFDDMAVISSRSNGTGCPFCSGSSVIPGETDLATVQPDVVELWNWEKNGNLKPEQFSPKSNIKVWWKCGKGHEWMALINSISSGKRCPYCAGKKVLKGFNDLEYLRPDLMDEWNYERNEIKPSEITEHSGKKAWWKCRNCGHEWYAVIDSRSKGHGCPACARKKQW